MWATQDLEIQCCPDPRYGGGLVISGGARFMQHTAQAPATVVPPSRRKGTTAETFVNQQLLVYVNRTEG